MEEKSKKNNIKLTTAPKVAVSSPPKRVANPAGLLCLKAHLEVLLESCRSTHLFIRQQPGLTTDIDAGADAENVDAWVFGVRL